MMCRHACSCRRVATLLIFVVIFPRICIRGYRLSSRCDCFRHDRSQGCLIDPSSKIHPTPASCEATTGISLGRKSEVSDPVTSELQSNDRRSRVGIFRVTIMKHVPSILPSRCDCFPVAKQRQAIASDASPRNTCPRFSGCRGILTRKSPLPSTAALIWQRQSKPIWFDSCAPGVAGNGA